MDGKFFERKADFMSIFVCGDIHSTLDINKLDCFIGREDLNENDYLIIFSNISLCD